MKHPALAPLHLGTLRNAVQGALRVDRSQFQPGFALRCAVGVAISLLGALAAGSPRQGVAGAIGALSTGFASQQGLYRTRAAAMLATACAMSVSTLVAVLAGHSSVASIVLIAVWGYGYGVLSSLGPAASIVGLQSVVAFIVFGGQGLEPSAGVVQAALVLAGGLLQTFLLVLVWPLKRYSVERRALAGAYRHLADYARAAAGGDLESPGSQQFTRVRDTLSDPQPFARRGDIAVFTALLDEAERMRSTLAALAADRLVAAEQSGPDDPGVARVHDVLEACADLLAALASALDAAQAPRAADDAWKRADDAARALEGASGANKAHAATDAAAILGQLRAAWRLVALPSGEEPAARVGGSPLRRKRAFPRIADQLGTLRANLSLRSPYAQHGIRLAVTLATATLLYRALGIQHGYWMTMTAAIVLRPDFTTTFARGIARIVGTVLGALLAGGLALLVPKSPAVDVALAILFATLTFATPNVNYAFFAAALTAYIIFLFSLLGTSAHTAGAQRVIATILGGGLAELAVFLYPAWEADRVPGQLGKLLDVQRRYADVVFAAYIDAAKTDERAIGEAQTASWTARTEAEASVDRMLSEPPQTHALSADTALGVLAASRRLGFGLLTLNAHHAAIARVARPALRILLEAIDKVLRSTANALRTQAPPRPYPALRQAFDAAQRAHASAGDPDAEEIFTECDLLVDSLNTMAGLVAAEFAASKKASSNEARSLG